MLFPERRFGLVNNSNNLFDYLFSDPVFNVNTTTNRMSTDIKEKEMDMNYLWKFQDSIKKT